MPFIFYFILLILCFSSCLPYYKYNILFYNQYRIIRKINKIKPDDFILVYSYKNLIKLKHKNSLYILYGNTQTKRACIFYNGKCVVSYRPIESIKLFEKYFNKYLVERK